MITFQCENSNCPNHVNPVQLDTDETVIYCGGCYTEQEIKP